MYMGVALLVPSCNEIKHIHGCGFVGPCLIGL